MQQARHTLGWIHFFHCGVCTCVYTQLLLLQLFGGAFVTVGGGRPPAEVTEGKKGKSSLGLWDVGLYEGKPVVYSQHTAL